MIGIDYGNGFIVYLLLWLITIAILWIRELLRVKSYNWDITKNKLFNCDHCHYAFTGRDSSNVTRCPRCNNMCIVRKKRRM
jgi:uncharacterized paraquat-inducible protein A